MSASHPKGGLVDYQPASLEVSIFIWIWIQNVDDTNMKMLDHIYDETERFWIKKKIKAVNSTF